MVMAVASTGASSRATVSTSVNVTIPSGVVAGELVVAYLAAAFPSSTAASAAFTPPTGAGTWTLGPSAVYHDTVNGAWVTVAMYYKYAVGTETAGGNWAFAISTTGELFCLSWASRITGYGATSGNPFVDTTQTANNGTANSTALSLPTFTPGGAGSLLFGIHFAGSSAGTMNTPTAWTAAATFANDGTDGVASGIRYIVQTTAVATGATSFGYTTSTTMGVLIGTIRPAGTGFAAGAALSGAGTLAGTGKPALAASAALSGAGSLGAGGAPGLPASAALSGSGSLGAPASPGQAAAAALSGSGTLAASAVPKPSTSAALAGSGALSASAVSNVGATAALSGSGTLSATAALPGGATATLSGSGTLATSVKPGTSSLATFTGSGTLTGSVVPGARAAAVMTGVGVLSASVKAGATSQATFTGVGVLSASTKFSAVALAALSGVGTLTAIAVRTFAGSATLSGLGTLVAADSGAFRDLSLSGSPLAIRWDVHELVGRFAVTVADRWDVHELRPRFQQDPLAARFSTTPEA